MKVSILGSGSQGNSTLIVTHGVKFLIDAGFSAKKTEEKLASIGESLENISAIIITHEHGDHILGAGAISRKYNIPIYISKESYEAAQEKIGKLEENNLKFIGRQVFRLSDEVEIIPFDVMHDAVRTLGFKVNSQNGKKLGIATDIGQVNNIVRDYFKDVDILVLECNYDFNLLMNCGYPMDLKHRIKSNSGHLSNTDAVKFICDIHTEKLQKVYLAHVSKDSNHHDIIKKLFADELQKNNINLEIQIALQDEATEIFEVK